MAPICDKSFSSNYMLLSPEDAKPFDLFPILFSKNIQKRKFVDLPEGTASEAGFKERWIIFISVLLQKLLHLVAKPMAWVGSFVEMFLNLVSSNKNLLVLLWNILRGKVVWPDKSSATYLSLIGFTDKRVKLDESIKHGTSRYYAALCIMASKASYENKAFLETTVKKSWQMDFMGSYDFYNDYQDKYTTQAFMFRDKTGKSDVVVVAFRGTQPFDADDWCTDVDLSWYELHGVGRIHAGFMKALGLQKGQGWPKEIDPHRPAFAYYTIRAILRKLMIENENMKFIVTGHSLGGALAVLFPTILTIHNESGLLERLEGIYTYGQPRVGDVKFGEYMLEKLKYYGVPYHRIVYCNDLVPRLPFDDSCMMFKHFGNCFFFNSLYKGKILAEVPDKNYFSPIWIIPMFLNAIWELIRSFLIPFLKGRDYIETLVMEGCRLFALVFPGLTAHCPQDYDNSTRLGTDIFLSNKITHVIKIE